VLEVLFEGNWVNGGGC